MGMGVGAGATGVELTTQTKSSLIVPSFVQVRSPVTPSLSPYPSSHANVHVSPAASVPSHDPGSPLGSVGLASTAEAGHIVGMGVGAGATEGVDVGMDFSELEGEEKLADAEVSAFGDEGTESGLSGSSEGLSEEDVVEGVGVPGAGE